jgi:hypothetical protein
MTNQQFSIGLLAVALIAGCSSTSAQATNSGSPSGPAATGAEGRVFELRIYTANEGKLPDLERRFRDHTTRIFERMGMTNIGYWVPQDSLSTNTIVYVLAYPNRAEATRMWAAFRVDPEWVAARTASEVNGPLVKSVQSIFMNPTDYSPMR